MSTAAKLVAVLDAHADLPVTPSLFLYASDYPDADQVFRAWVSVHPEYALREGKHGLVIERRDTFDAIATLYPQRPAREVAA